VALAHARGFSIRRRGGESWVEVRRPWQGASADFRYRLVPRDSLGRPGFPDPAARLPGPDAPLTLPMPLGRVITLTTTNLPHLEAVGALDRLVGISGGRYACNARVRSRLAAGGLPEIGEEAGLDAEAALDLRPDAVFAFAVASWSNPALKKLREAGLPVVMEGVYMEETPLGRAEWIKFTAEFFGRGAAADSLFAAVDSAYRALSALAKTAASRPTVVVNGSEGGLWWMPGGRSYVARFLADAGARYLWAGDTTRGSLNLGLETVIREAGDADFWLNPGEAADLAALRSRDPRHAMLKAFREGRVWNFDAARCGAGNEYFEQGSTRPDLVLADLIAIFHPGLLPGHRFRWYRRLEGG
jgi:iron complex transport system substrate-binding protein